MMDGGTLAVSANLRCVSCTENNTYTSLRDADESIDTHNRTDGPVKKPSVFLHFVFPSLLLSFAVVAIAANVIVLPTTDGYENLPYFKSLQLSGAGVSGLPVPTNTGHKPLLPLDKTDYIGFGCAVVGLIIAGGGGIGGGGILIPIYILIMGFQAKSAIPLGNVTVFGGALANTMLNSVKRHPLANRPLVDWDLILVMEPLTIAGALIGAIFSKLLPEVVIVIMLVLVLGYTANNTLKKGFKMYRKETKEILEEELRKEKNGGKEPLLANPLGDDSEREDKGAVNRSFSSQAKLRGMVEEESKTPVGNVLVVVVMTAVVLVTNVLKGGGAFPSPLGIVCGSYAFWGANIFMLTWLCVIAYFVRRHLVKRCELKNSIGYPYVEGDMVWDARATFVYPCICSIAGLFAGLFGVGGGIVKGPLMLAMEVHPKVASATSAQMILFTSFTATTSYVVFGLLIPDYAIVCLIVGYVSTLSGQIMLYFFMHKFKRNSFIVFSIGTVVLLSAILLSISMIENIIAIQGKPVITNICSSGN